MAKLSNDPKQIDWSDMRLQELWEKSGAHDYPVYDMDGSYFEFDGEEPEYVDFSQSISWRLGIFTGMVDPMDLPKELYERWK